MTSVLMRSDVDVIEAGFGFARFGSMDRWPTHPSARTWLVGGGHEGREG